MITASSTTFSDTDKVADIIFVDIEEAKGLDTPPRVHLSIGITSLHMSWKQFEGIVQKIVVAWDAENQRRGKRLKAAKEVTSLNMEVGDAIKLDDKLGGGK